MTYNDIEMRELTAKDIFPMVAILKKVGFSKVKQVFEGSDFSSDDTAKVGLTVVFGIVEIVIDNIDKCQDDLFSFLASVCQCEQSDIEEMGLGDFAALIMAVFEKEEFQDFFKVVSGFFK